MNNSAKLINGKKVLFFAPSFFGYELKIKTKMEEMGAIVDFYDVRSISSATQRALLKIFPTIFIKKTNRYYNKILEMNEEKNYDYVFIVKCDMITESILIEMKMIYKEAIFCLYLWDSIKNIPGVEDKFKHFDKVLSFDRLDSLNHNNIIFRPLFFLDEYKKNESPSINRQYIYDISFLGTIHSDRNKIINDMKFYCKKNGLRLYTYKYLQSKFMYYFYKLVKKDFRGANKNDFAYHKKGAEEITKVIDETKVILDIQHPRQTGLTMRTIEMLGMNKKILTTNEDIINYDFYNPQNIQVIKRKEFKITLSFFNDEYQSVDNNIYERYYIENWITDILIIEKEVN